MQCEGKGDYASINAKSGPMMLDLEMAPRAEEEEEFADDEEDAE
jgi:hypothetical protein